MHEYIVWLDAVDIDPVSQIGSKAANLARLFRAGIPVPDAFFITTAAYCDFLGVVGQPETAETVGVLNQELARAILANPLPPDLQIQVLEAYRLLRSRHGPDPKTALTPGSPSLGRGRGALPLPVVPQQVRAAVPRVAVRSSASAEDLPGASFAGQYASILDVGNENDLLEAVKHCWASTFSPQVEAYRGSHGLRNTRMAVIVQVMVPAEFAGVLFTTDPLHEDGSEIVIEMAPGIGDNVVSGKVMPLCVTMNRQTAKLTSMKGSTASQGVVHNDRPSWKLLCDLALQIEGLFGSPQDIEWAYDGGRFWILQSRPITARVSGHGRQIWTRANAGEIMPGVVSPLTWSVFKPMLQDAGRHRALSPLTIHWRWQHPSGTWPDSPRLFRGRAYMELASVYAGLGNMPGVSPDILRKMLGFEFHLCRKGELPRRRPRWHVMDPYRYLRFWLEILGLTKTLPHQGGRWSRKGKSGQSLHILGQQEPDAILAYVDRLLAEGARILGLHIQCTSMAFASFGLLDRLAHKYARSEEAQKFELDLISDFRSMGTVQQGIAMWDLAQAARRVPPVTEALFQLEEAEQVIASWRCCPEAADFVHLWETFIAHFGDRGSEEFELAIAHWDEDSSFVLRTIKEILEHPGPDPRERLSYRQQCGQQSIRSMTHCVRAHGLFAETWLFSRLVATYQRLVMLRENMKYGVVSRFNSLRKAFVALGKGLEQQGLLRSADDVFFLRYEEIRDLVKHPSSAISDAGTRIAQRRREHNEYAQTAVPDIWVSVDGRTMPMELPARRDGKILQGIGCSPGQISGPAHVLLSVREDSVVAPGQILVIPCVDPGLTPFFLTAAGLVTEIGGVLSHGATVAREYGLPAVVGVPHATEIIRAGQRITVDGSAGLVYLEPMGE